MVRYSTENAIPKMTSNITPSGIASASSVYNASYPAWKAFNGTAIDNFDAWASLDNQPQNYIQYEFPNEVLIGKYSIQSYNVAGLSAYDAKNWRFEGFNESTQVWDVLDTRTNQTFTQGQTKEYTFQANKKYKKYRLNNIVANGGSRVVIAEIKMFEDITKTKILIKKTDGVYAYYDTTTSQWSSVGSSPTETDWLNKGVDTITQAQLEKLSQQAITGKFAVKRL